MRLLLVSLVILSCGFVVWWASDSLPTAVKNMHSNNFMVREGLLISGGEIGRREKKAKAGHWEVLHCEEADFELAVYSAFYDTRDASRGAGPIVVRLIGVSENAEALQVTLLCMLWYAGDPVPEVSHVTSTPISGGGGAHRGFIYVCPVHRRAVPAHVSVVCSSAMAPQFFLPVEIPPTPEQKRDFAVCVQAAFGEPDIYMIIEWVELHKILGVSKITVYNHSLTDRGASIFTHYADEGILDFRQTDNFWNKTHGSTAHWAPVINDCMYRNMNAFNKILVLDFDEYFVPRMHNNLSEMMQAIDHSLQTKHPTRTYTFRNTFFFRDTPEDTSMPPLTTLRYRNRYTDVVVPMKNVKSMVDPQACTNMHHHECWAFTEAARRQPDFKAHVHERFAMKHHYRKCPFDRFKLCPQLIKEYALDNTILRFKDILIERVRNRLAKLGMEPLY